MSKEQGKNAEAAELYQRVLAIKKKALGPSRSREMQDQNDESRLQHATLRRSGKNGRLTARVRLPCSFDGRTHARRVRAPSSAFPDRRREGHSTIPDRHTTRTGAVPPRAEFNAPNCTTPT